MGKKRVRQKSTLPGSNPEIEAALHRGPRHRGLRRDWVERLRNRLAILQTARDMTEVGGPFGWRVHQLGGDRAGTWSIHVSGNWCLTFEIKAGDVRNLNREDYH